MHLDEVFASKLQEEALIPARVTRTFSFRRRGKLELLCALSLRGRYTDEKRAAGGACCAGHPSALDQTQSWGQCSPTPLWPLLHSRMPSPPMKYLPEH